MLLSVSTMFGSASECHIKTYQWEKDPDFVAKKKCLSDRKKAIEGLELNEFQVPTGFTAFEL